MLCAHHEETQGSTDGNMAIGFNMLSMLFEWTHLYLQQPHISAHRLDVSLLLGMCSVHLCRMRSIDGGFSRACVHSLLYRTTCVVAVHNMCSEVTNEACVMLHPVIYEGGGTTSRRLLSGRKEALEWMTLRM